MKTENRARFYQKLGRPPGQFSLTRRQQDVLSDKKWLKFLKLARFFRQLPFTEFVLGAGSLALGNARRDSDFDVIVGAKAGRIFTARFFCVLMFDLLGRRRRKFSRRKEASDKICFNHFITPVAYRLRPPYNIYWRELYGNLVPIYGPKDKIQEFFKANDWMGKRIYSDDLRHQFYQPGFGGIFWEKILSGRFGDLTERLLKRIQVRRIKKNLRESSGFEPRFVFNDEELEFHPDTLRIHKLISDEK